MQYLARKSRYDNFLVQNQFALHLILYAVFIIALLACKPVQEPSKQDSVQVRIAKWKDNHKAAISLTHDAGWIAEETVGRINALVTQNKLHLGYEMVTSGFRDYPQLWQYAQQSMKTENFSFFGHGDTHINHDSVSYDSALTSFSRCAETMRSFGLRPIAYAYPHGGGFRAATQNALQRAGFLSARAFSFGKGEKSLIAPDSSFQPENWYFLPSLVMQDIAFEQCDSCINSNAELIPYLDAALRRGAWLTTTYHAIGDEKGWGYYKLSEFQADLESVRERDFWCASLQDVTLYLKERAQVQVKLQTIPQSDGSIHIEMTLTDNLDNATYNFPLTALISIPEHLRGKSAILYNDSLQELVIPTLSAELVLQLLPHEKKYVLSISAK